MLDSVSYKCLTFCIVVFLCLHKGCEPGFMQKQISLVPELSKMSHAPSPNQAPALSICRRGILIGDNYKKVLAEQGMWPSRNQGGSKALSLLPRRGLIPP
jgi:hypothetical protein